MGNGKKKKDARRAPGALTLPLKQKNFTKFYHKPTKIIQSFSRKVGEQPLVVRHLLANVAQPPPPSFTPATKAGETIVS